MLAQRPSSYCEGAAVSTQGTVAVKQRASRSRSPDAEQYRCRNIKEKINNLYQKFICSCTPSELITFCLSLYSFTLSC